MSAWSANSHRRRNSVFVSASCSPRLQHDALLAADLEVAEHQRPGRGGLVQLDPAQERPDAGRQLLDDHRLGHVVVGTGLQPRHQVDGVGLGGDDHDRHDAAVRIVRQTSKPGHVGQPQVEEHEVGLVPVEEGQAGAAVPRLVHLVALVLQGEADGQADLVVVLDEEQAVHASATAVGRLGDPRTGAVIVTEHAQSGRPSHADHVRRVPPGGMPSSPWRPTGRCAVGFGDDGGCSGTTSAGAPGWSSAQRPPSSPSDVRACGPGSPSCSPSPACSWPRPRRPHLLARPQPALQPARRRRPAAGLHQRPPRPGPPARRPDAGRGS